MDIFFADPDQVPLPPDEVRVLDIQIDPFPDGRRVRVFFELTPFQKKPSGEIIVADQLGNVVAATSFIEVITPKNELVLHLRAFDDAGYYRLTLTLYYNEEIPAEQGTDDAPLMRPGRKIIHHKEIEFELTP